MQKIFSHIGIGEVIYTKRVQSRSIRISVSPARGVRVSLPFYLSYAKAVEFVDANIPRIMAILNTSPSRLDGGARDGYMPEELKQIRKEAHKILPDRLKEISEKLNATILVKNRLGVRRESPFCYNRLAIKNNRSNWGSCSSAGNINLNMHLVRLPQELMDFVIIHELGHLVYPNHGARFHELVNLACGGREKELSRRLKGYRPGERPELPPV